MSDLKIKGNIINASFPRSGHRFLKDHLTLLLGDNFRYFDHYHSASASNKNFAKTHDFELSGESVLNDEFPDNRKYLVQVRHPLESIISYYEFKRHWNRIKVDDREIFMRHLNKQLTKWKRFCDVWCLAPMSHRLIVDYQSLYANPAETLAIVCEFIGEEKVNREQFDAGSVEFRRYYSDEQGQRSQRNITDFRFYDHDEFTRVEDDLYETYMKPIGLERRL